VNKQIISISIIKFARSIFANTPANRWVITAKIKSAIFKLAIKEEELEVEYYGVRLLLPTKDTSLVPSIVGGYYEKLELLIFQKACEGSKIILDVGGNIGLFSLVASRASADARIYSFEPVPENQDYFVKNLHLNKCTNVKLIKEALGAKKGNIAIHLSPDDIGTHTIGTHIKNSKQKIIVPINTLDNFTSKLKNVDVIKIDVEGYDGYVLNGARITIEKFRPTIFLEFIPDLLIKAGYNPQDFLENIYGKYKYCYLINEPKNIVRRVSQDNLIEFATSVSNSNLVLTNDNRLAHYIEKSLLNGAHK